MSIRFDILARLPVQVHVNEGRRLLSFAIGTEYTVVQDRLSGNVDDITAEGNTISIRGWMADKTFLLPPVAIIATLDGMLAATNNAFTTRPDVSQFIGAAMDEFGFTMMVKARRPSQQRLELWGVLQGDEICSFGLVKVDIVPGLKKLE